MMSTTSIVISDMHVAALRSFFTEGPMLWRERYGRQLDREDDFGYSLLLQCALAKAAERKFAPTYSLPEIIRFVAHIRRETDGASQELNPRVAEEVLRYALGDRSLNSRPPFGVTQVTMARTQLYLLMALVLDRRVDKARLDELISASLELAKKLGHRATGEPRST